MHVENLNLFQKPAVMLINDIKDQIVQFGKFTALFSNYASPNPPKVLYMVDFVK